MSARGGLATAFHGLAARDDRGARLAGAFVAVGVIALAIVVTTDLVPDAPIVSKAFVLGYIVIVPVVALAPSQRFLLAQTAGAVTLYLIARVSEDRQWWEVLALIAQQVVFFIVLTRAPLERIAVRRVLIATTTLVLVPVYYCLDTCLGAQTDVFVGSWRQFVLLVVIMALKTRRGSAKTVRNMALAALHTMPIPLESADTPDRRFVTLIEGGAIFTIGIVVQAVMFRLPSVAVDWSANPLLLAGSLIVYMLQALATLGGFGFQLMGHCYLMGVRVAAPIQSPHRFTNLIAAWRGTGYYFYRFAFDGYYRQFFSDKAGSALATIAKITGVFLVIGYIHFVWGPPLLSGTAMVIWTVQGITTGLTVVYLQQRSKQQLRAYLSGSQKPARPAWHILLVPLFVAAVLAFRGLMEYGLDDSGFVHHLATMLDLRN